jgi:hypothetical protein
LRHAPVQLKAPPVIRNIARGANTFATRVDRRGCSAMRLLPVGPDHGHRRILGGVPHPSDADIDANIANICRCGTYDRLRRAIHRAADMTKA